jgi:FkbM family methyltransferase
MQFEYRSKSFDIEGTSQKDYIYRRISDTGTFYEIDLLEYMYMIKPFIHSKRCRNVAIDIGANIGNHSIFLSTFLADHLIAIEPNPNVLFRLRRNLSRNANNYTLIECAVGEKESKGTIILPENMGDNIGAARVNVHDNGGNIEISTVDAIFSSWKDKEDNLVSVSLIKIDVEGMEPEVLKGAETTILKYRPHIFAEAATDEELLRIHNYLRSLGYRKMPGHWAATPVYHFAYNPTLALSTATYYWQFRKKAARKILKWSPLSRQL